MGTHGELMVTAEEAAADQNLEAATLMKGLVRVVGLTDEELEACGVTVVDGERDVCGIHTTGEEVVRLGVMLADAHTVRALRQTASLNSERVLVAHAVSVIRVDGVLSKCTVVLACGLARILDGDQVGFHKTIAVEDKIVILASVEVTGVAVRSCQGEGLRVFGNTNFLHHRASSAAELRADDVVTSRELEPTSNDVLRPTGESIDGILRVTKFLVCERLEVNVADPLMLMRDVRAHVVVACVGGVLGGWHGRPVSCEVTAGINLASNVHEAAEVNVRDPTVHLEVVAGDCHIEGSPGNGAAGHSANGCTARHVEFLGARLAVRQRAPHIGAVRLIAEVVLAGDKNETSCDVCASEIRGDRVRLVLRHHKIAAWAHCETVGIVRAGIRIGVAHVRADCPLITGVEAKPEHSHVVLRAVGAIIAGNLVRVRLRNLYFNVVEVDPLENGSVLRVHIRVVANTVVTRRDSDVIRDLVWAPAVVWANRNVRCTTALGEGGVHNVVGVASGVQSAVGAIRVRARSGHL
eukprot:PhM_4_TR1314/c1_g1_i1/m.52898